jgi:uncharacterized membrane protein YkoI
VTACHIAIVAALALSAGTVGAAEPAMKGAQFAATARIALTTARFTALKVRPGTITDQELEKEKGGSGLRYSFDIMSGGKPYEVGVDAKTGTVLENVAEGRNPD